MVEAFAIIGIVVTVIQRQSKTLLPIIPAALITFACSVPVFKIHGKKKRLMEFLLVKITLLSLIWCFMTVTLPMVENNTAVFSTSSVFIFIERFLFIFAICIPFEIRDMEQEKKRGITNLPQHIGVNMSKAFGIFLLFLFILIRFIQRSDSTGTATFKYALPLTIPDVIAGFLILLSHQHRSNYYFRVFIDGTMHLQLILLIVFNSFR